MTSSAVLLVTLLAVPLAGADGWQRLHAARGPGGAVTAVVDTRAQGGSTLVRTTATLPRAPAALRAVLLDLERYPMWFPNLDGWRVLDRAAGAAHAWGRHDLPWPFSPRDYVVRYAWRDAPGGAFTLSAQAATGVGPPPQPGVVRLPRVASSWQVSPAPGGGALVVYTYDADLAGVPEVLQQGAWQSEGPALLQALAAEAGRRAPVGSPRP